MLVEFVGRRANVNEREICIDLSPKLELYKRHSSLEIVADVIVSRAPNIYFANCKCSLSCR